MPAAPVVAKKLTKTDTPGGLEAEMMRKCKVYRNNVDPERSNLNITWQRDGLGMEDAIAARIGELNLKRSLRSDAIKAEGFVVSCNRWDMPLDTAVKFLKEANDWFDNRYGIENTISWAIHCDEGVPHLHRWQVPVIKGEDGAFDRVSAKELFSPDSLTKLQLDFYEQVSSKYGYDRPLTKDERKESGISYAGFEAFKAKEESKAAHAEREVAVARLEETQAQVEKCIQYRDEAKEKFFACAKQAQEAAQEVSRLETKVETLKTEIEGLQDARDGLKSEVEELKRERNALEAMLDKAKAVVVRVAELLAPYLPDPIKQLARFLRDEDWNKVDEWHDRVEEAAIVLASELPSRSEEEWRQMVGIAKTGADIADQNRQSRGYEPPIL